jgi:hypothetical protein
MSTLPEMLRDLGGPSGPSWPWRTKSARQVWMATEAFFEENPDVSPDTAIRSAFAETGIPGGELTPEDFNILGLAARWKYTVLPHKKKTGGSSPSLRPQAMTANQMLKTQEER